MSDNKIQDIIKFLQRSNKLKFVPRYLQSLYNHNDSVADHSWRLALMAFLVVSELNIKVDLTKMLIMALIHDLAEIKAGDVDAMQIIMGQTTFEEKNKQEAIAMQELITGLGFGGQIHAIWKEYEENKTIEAKLLCALDKIEAYLHLADRGVISYTQQEFHADYADWALNSLEQATNELPEIRELLDLVKQDLKQQFEALDIVWLEGENG
jgi:putative hydrolase of HD superfamily